MKVVNVRLLCFQQTLQSNEKMLDFACDYLQTVSIVSAFNSNFYLPLGKILKLWFKRTI